MSLKKKKVKKGKRNKIVEVLKNSLSKADELNRKLLKEVDRKDNENACILETLNNTRIDVYALQRQVEDLKERLKLRESVERLSKIKGKRSSILIADDKVGISDKVRKSYEPSELVDPGELLNTNLQKDSVAKDNYIVFHNAKRGKDFKLGVDLSEGKSNSDMPPFIMHDGRADLITEFNKELLGIPLDTEGFHKKLTKELKKTVRTVNKFGEVLENGKKVKIEKLKSGFKNGRVTWGIGELQRSMQIKNIKIKT